MSSEITSLGADLLMQVFSFLEEFDLDIVSKVCKEFWTVARQDALWRPMILKRKITLKEKQSAKEGLIEYYKVFTRIVVGQDLKRPEELEINRTDIFKQQALIRIFLKQPEVKKTLEGTLDNALYSGVNLSQVVLLLEAGCEPTDLTLYGLLKFGNQGKDYPIEMIELLIQHGAKIKTEHLDEILISCNPDILKLILSSKAGELPKGAWEKVLNDPRVKPETLEVLLEHGGVKVNEDHLIQALKSKISYKGIQVLLQKLPKLSEKVFSEALKSNQPLLVMGLLVSKMTLTNEVIKWTLEKSFPATIIKMLKGFVSVPDTYISHALDGKQPIEILELLMEKGATLPKDALERAVEAECPHETIAFLIEKGASIPENIMDKALEKDYGLKTLVLLLENKAALTEKSLDFALQKKRSDKEIKMLLEKGAKVTKETMRYALEGDCSIEVVQLLLLKGASFDKDSLEIAISNHNDKAVIEEILNQIHEGKIEQEVTPEILDLAINKYSAPETLEMLILKLKVKPSEKTVDLALHHEYSVTIIEALIKAGGIWTEDSVRIALERHAAPIEILQLLLKLGAEVPNTHSD